MIETLQDTFTVCVQHNPNGTYTLAGLVNIDDKEEDVTICVYVRDSNEEFQQIAQTNVDEFRYFEVRELDIQIVNHDPKALYFGLANSDILERVELEGNI